MYINNRHGGINGINRVRHGYPNKTIDRRPSVETAKDFAEVLENSKQNHSSVKFSKHAQMRLEARNIKISPEQSERILRGVDKAKEKGVRDSLVMVDDIAFVINVKNRTVITAVSSSELKENVFTNIDGAVFT